MAPEVVLRKLEHLRQLVADLRRHEGASVERVREHHYEVERILELLVTSSADLPQHRLAEREVVASSYRDVFRRASAEGLLSPSLATKLEEAMGMRNVLVHLYDEIDYEILQRGIGEALAGFPALIAELLPRAR